MALERSIFSSQELRSLMSESINILARPSISCMTSSKSLNLFESKTILTKNNLFSWGLFISLNEYLGPYYISVTLLGTAHTALNKTDSNRHPSTAGVPDGGEKHK